MIYIKCILTSQLGQRWRFLLGPRTLRPSQQQDTDLPLCLVDLLSNYHLSRLGDTHDVRPSTLNI